MPVLTLVIILLLLAAPPAQAQNQGTRPNTVAPARPADTIQPLEANDSSLRMEGVNGANADTLIKRAEQTGQTVQQNLEQQLQNQGEDWQIRLEQRVQEHQEETESLMLNRRESLRQEMATRSANRSVTAQEHMSNVAVEVQSLLSVSERTGGIGQEIRAIAQAQQNTQASIAGELQQVESRNRLVRWIIGPDQDALTALNARQAEIDERIAQLQVLQLEAEDETTQQALENALIALEQQQILLDEKIETVQNETNLWGWLRQWWKRT